MTTRQWDLGGKIGSAISWLLSDDKIPIPGYRETRYSTSPLTPTALIAAFTSLASADPRLSRQYWDASKSSCIYGASPPQYRIIQDESTSLPHHCNVNDAAGIFDGSTGEQYWSPIPPRTGPARTTARHRPDIKYQDQPSPSDDAFGRPTSARDATIVTVTWRAQPRRDTAELPAITLRRGHF